MTRPKKRLLVAGIAAGILLLLVLAYNLLLSPFAIRTFWLPMVKERTGVEVQAEQAALSLFSQPTFCAENVRVKMPGCNVEAKSVSLAADPLTFLVSRRLTVSELRVAGVALEYDASGNAVPSGGSANPPAARSAGGRSPVRSTPSVSGPSGNESRGITSSPGSSNSSHGILVRKAELTDASLIFRTADGTRYEFSGLSIFCTDVVPSGRASLRFESLFGMRSGLMEISRTPVSGTVRLELGENSLMPTGIDAEFASGSMNLSGKGIPPVAAAFSMRLNAAWNDGRFLVRSSSLSVRDGTGAEVLNARIEGNLNQTSWSGSVSASLKTSRSALLDTMVRVCTGNAWKNVSLTADLTASLAESGNAVTAEGKAELSADSLFGDLRSIGSNFSLNAWKADSDLQFRNFRFLLRDNSGKRTLTAETSPDFNWKYDLRSRAFSGTGSLRLRAGNLDLAQLAGVLKAPDRLPVKSGILALDLTAQPSGNSGFALRGSASLNQFASTLGDLPADPVNLSTLFSLNLTLSPLGVVTESFHLTGETNRNRFLVADLKFSAPDLGRGTPMSAEAAVSEWNERSLAVLPFRKLRTLPIRSFRSEMNAKWTREKKELQTLSVSGSVGSLALTGADQPLELAFGTTLALEENTLRIDALSLAASEQHRDFLDLNLGGSLRFDPDLGTAKNRIRISSKFIDAEKLQKLALLLNADNASSGKTSPAPAAPPASAPSASTAPSAPPSSAPAAPPAPASSGASGALPKEPTPMDFSAFDGVYEFALEKVQYTGDLLLALHGPLEIDGNRIQAENLKLTANGSPVQLRFFLDAAPRDGWGYGLLLSLRNLQLPPLVRAAMKGEDPGVTGALSSVDIQLEGKGITPGNWKKHLKGTFRGTVSDLSFPLLSAEKINALKLPVIPLKAIPGLTDALNSDAVTGDLKTLRDNVAGILDGSKNVEFTRGSFDGHVSGGVVTLNKILLEGGTLKSESVNGTIHLLNEKLDLAASLNLGILVIPMKIGGTIRRPEPDFKAFLSRFAQDNLKNLLDPDNLENTVKNVDGLLKLFRGRKKK